LEHIAIMAGDAQTVARGFKTAELRFAKGRVVPYERILSGDLIYFKDLGGPFVARAAAGRAEFYYDLEPSDIEGFRRLYGASLNASEQFWQEAQDKRFATLIFLADIEPLKPYWLKPAPFNRSQWIVLDTPEKQQLWLGGLFDRDPYLRDNGQVSSKAVITTTTTTTLPSQ
jgi:hypothetical protein